MLLYHGVAFLIDKMYRRVIFDNSVDKVLIQTLLQKKYIVYVLG